MSVTFRETCFRIKGQLQSVSCSLLLLPDQSTSLATLCSPCAYPLLFSLFFTQRHQVFQSLADWKSRRTRFPKTIFLEEKLRVYVLEHFFMITMTTTNNIDNHTLMSVVVKRVAAGEPRRSECSGSRRRLQLGSTSLRCVRSGSQLVVIIY